MTNFLLVATLSMAIPSLVVGCGDDDGGDDAPRVDAAPGAGAPDGLGALCGVNQEVCPEETPRCLVFEDSTSLVGFCSALCVIDGTFQTDAQSQIVGVNPPLSSADASCAPLYTGALGVARCGATLDVSPALPLQPDTAYTFNAGCVIDCGPGGLCPGDLTCDVVRDYCVAP